MLGSKRPRARNAGAARHLRFLFPYCRTDAQQDGDQVIAVMRTGADPVLERILVAAGHDRSLYVLLTALMQSSDPKLLRAAEVSLRSLVKQSKQATVPWQSRPPGHFEPPSD